MPELIEILSPEERKTLTRLSLTAAVIILLLILSLFFWSYRLNGLRTEASRLTADLKRISDQNEQARGEFEKWQLTRQDLEELKKTAFYSGGDGLDTFRQDLKDLFNQTGLPVPPINYQYEDSEKKQFKRLAASFALKFSYPSLKKFLYWVETWPRLLIIDQINFQKIDNVSGTLDLRITLSGYYYDKNQ